MFRPRRRSAASPQRSTGAAVHKPRPPTEISSNAASISAGSEIRIVQSPGSKTRRPSAEGY
ncbi:MAG: hypothetical protein ACKPIZ_28400, partial [Microcystis panniformis]